MFPSVLFLGFAVVQRAGIILWSHLLSERYCSMLSKQVMHISLLLKLFTLLFTQSFFSDAFLAEIN